MPLAVLPPPEPNWLLTSLLTASAAVISIVAGLLVARLVTKDSDKQHADRELAVQRAACTASRNELTRTTRSLTREQSRDFIRRSLHQIVEEFAIVSVDELMTKHEADGLGVDDLKPAVEDAKSRVVAVRTDLLNRVTERDDSWAVNWPRTWAGTQRRYKVTVPPGEEYLHELIWEQLWQVRTFEERDQQLRELLKAHEAYALARAQWLAFGQNGPAPQPPKVTSTDLESRWATELDSRPIASMPPRRQERMDALSDAASASREALVLAQARVALAQSATQETRRPGVVIAALVILSYLTVAGVAAPLWLLAHMPVTLAPAWRWLLSGSFLLGVMALVAMLFIASRAPRPTVVNQTPDQPTGA